MITKSIFEIYVTYHNNDTNQDEDKTIISLKPMSRGEIISHMMGDSSNIYFKNIEYTVSTAIYGIDDDVFLSNAKKVVRNKRGGKK